jgi:opacity protein-like surface antigen
MTVNIYYIVSTVKEFRKRAVSLMRLLVLFFITTIFSLLIQFPPISANKLYSQTSDYSVSVKANYTSYSRYYVGHYNYTNLLDEQYYSVDDLLGYGFDLRFEFLNNYWIGVSGEFVSGDFNYNHRSYKIPCKSQYSMFIGDLACYYFLPLSGDRFKINIGGGLNFAKASNKDEIVYISSEQLSSPINVGILALCGVEYTVAKNFSVRGEIKFRDPIVENENKFNTSIIAYDDKTYSIPTRPYKSKINIDGIVFELSAVFYLF